MMGEIPGDQAMPIRDHFRPPIGNRLPWESLHSGWAAEIAGRLNDLLPPGYVALDRMRISDGLEIDIGASIDEEFQHDSEHPSETSGVNGDGGVAIAATPTVYKPPTASGSLPFDFPDVTEVRIFQDREGRRVIGAIELVSPRNKDRGQAREGFVAKCLDYLASGASLLIVDAVTDRHANLHTELAQRIGVPAALELPDGALYAASYRPVIRQGKPQLDVWVNPFAIGDVLPTMPLRLLGDHFVPVELEVTYIEACRRRRFVP